MTATANSSSSPAADERLLRVPLDRLHPHPANPNLMDEGRLETLARNIEREGRYPPLIVRPHPTIAGEWQFLDGKHRGDVLKALGHVDALCYVWPCDDATALLLLATLNRLEGEDLPAKRADLLSQLMDAQPGLRLAELLPEDDAAIKDALSLLAVDTESLLRELTAAAGRSSELTARACTFALLPGEEATVERAVAAAAEGLTGKNRRGRALAAVCLHYLEARDG